VVSPYLQKPQRKLDDVLRDRGLTYADLGLRERVRGDAPQAGAANRNLGRARGMRLSVLVGSIAGLFVIVVLAAGVILTMPTEQIPVAEEVIEQLRNIAPAAGSSADAPPGQGMGQDGAGSPALSPSSDLTPIDPNQAIQPL